MKSTNLDLQTDLSQAALQSWLPETACSCQRACSPTSAHSLIDKASRQTPMLSVAGAILSCFFPLR